MDKEIVNIQPTEIRSIPVLHKSVFHGHYEIAELLLENGADINSPGYENNQVNTPAIVLAAWEGGNKVLELLLRKGANPNLKSSNEVSAISTAFRNGKDKTVKMLLKYEAKIR